MDLYADNILDHYRHPRHKLPLAAGKDGGLALSLSKGEGSSVQHEEKNISCGDTITVSLTIENGNLTHITWLGDGCAISQAAMSMLAEHLHPYALSLSNGSSGAGAGKSILEVDALTADDIRELLHVPIGTRRVKCALLCLHALKNALHTYRKEPLQGWMETVGNAGKAS